MIYGLYPELNAMPAWAKKDLRLSAIENFQTCRVGIQEILNHPFAINHGLCNVLIGGITQPQPDYFWGRTF
jgi:hypothetical protein